MSETVQTEIEIHNICPECGKSFDGQQKTEWQVRCEAHIGPFGEDKHHRDLISIDSCDIHKVPLRNWFCCSKGCAKIQYRKWLRQVLEHPFTQESLKEEL